MMVSLRRSSMTANTATTTSTTSTTTGLESRSLLTDEMLARFSERAPKHDQENTFFADDFDELQRAGYLKLAVPAPLGGLGLALRRSFGNSAVSRITLRRRPWRSTCTSIGPVLRQISGGPATTH
jgi:hypothetical protein